jgi:tetratricopeptide (TPR) repeat protein
MGLSRRLGQLAASTRDHVVLPFSYATQSARLHWLAPDESVWSEFPELEDVEDELASYLPLASAALAQDQVRCVVVHREAPHAVFVFDDGFRELAPSLEAFAASLLGADERTPAAVLEDACVAASTRLEAGDHAGAVALLGPALALHPRAPSEHVHRELRKRLASAWTDLGVAYHALGDDRAAGEAYEVARDWGSKAAVENLLSLAVEEGRWAEARSLVEALREWFHTPDSQNALVVTQARVLCATNDREAAAALGAQHAGYLRALAAKELPRAETLRTQLLAGLDALAFSGAAREALDALRDPLSTPLPAPPAPSEISQGDVATAVRLIGATKIPQLRSLLTKLPGLIREAAVVGALAALPDGARSGEVRALVADIAAKAG